MNTMAFAISSGVPMRLVGMCASRKFALFSFVCAKRLNIAVSVGPGPTMLTRTPVPASSIAADFVIPSTACLLPTYTAAVGPPTLPYADETLTMLPLPKHRSNLVLHTQKHTQHIGVEDGLIALRGYIANRTWSALGASIIDGNVEATETSNGLVDEVFDFVFVAHIGAYKFGLSPEVAQFSG